MGSPSRRASPCPRQVRPHRPRAPESPGAPDLPASFVPHARGARVRGQAFGIGERRGNATQTLGGGLRYLDDAGALLEVVDAERRRKARAAGGGNTWFGPAQ